MTGKLKIGVLASGNGSNLQAIIDSCECGEIDGEVVVVVSDNAASFALKRAKKHAIPVVFADPAGKTRKELDAEIDNVLSQHKVELVCLAGYMRLLSSHFVRKYFGRLMNIHPALLPSFKGTCAQRDAIEYGVKVSGCTVHFVDEEMDHGPIILQECVKISEDDTVEKLAMRILDLEHKAYPKAIKLYQEGRLEIVGRVVKIG